MKRSLTVLALLASLGLAGSAQASTRVAVLDLEAGPGTASAAGRVSAALRRQVANTSGLTIALGKTLAEIKLIFGCTERPRRAYHRCLAKAGHSMKADKIIVGKLRRSGSGYKVVLTLVDMARPLRPQTISARISRRDTSGSRLRARARVWVGRLFGRSSSGVLLVTCSTDGVSVTVGGNVLGTCSTTATKITLSPGTHRVTFSKSGFRTSTRLVGISAGQTSRLSMSMARIPRPRRLLGGNAAGSGAEGNEGVTPPPPGGSKKDKRLVWKVLFYSTLGVGVAMLAGSIFTGLQVKSYEHDKEVRIRQLQDQGIYPGESNACRDNAGDDTLVSICNKGLKMANVTNALIGVGAALLAGSGVFLYLAYIAKDNKERATSLSPSFRGPGGSRVMVTPTIWVRGGGLSATLRF